MKRSVGFVLPTVVVSSIVLMTVLLAALQLASSAAAALRDQYYNTLAREAAEAGAVFMGECLKQGYFDTTKTVRPETDCEAVSRGALPVIYESGNLRTTFEGRYEMVGGNRATSVVGMSQLRRPGGGSVYKEYKYTARQHATQEEDRAATRASHRWWYIGQKTRIDFGIDDSHVPRAERVSNGHRIDEGITTISNRKGEVLFYTNGRTLWDKDNHEIRNSQGLMGSTSATQAVAVFPIDRSERYYVIVSNSANSPDIPGITQGHLYYSVLDIMANSGRGEILTTAKNIRMGGSGVYSSEALNAVPMPDGSGYWVYTYTPTPSNNKVWGFRFTEKSKADIAAYRKNPVNHEASRDVIEAYNVNAQDWHLRSRICKGNPPTITNDYHNTGTPFGTINFNHDYSRMVVMMGGGSCVDWAANYGTVHVLNVNRETGYLTRYTSFYAGDRNLEVDRKSEHIYAGYSADFSPSGRYIYTSTIYPARVRRFDIQDPDRNAVQQSMRFVGKSGCSDYVGPYRRDTQCRIGSYTLDGKRGEGGGQVLRGPNGKMYVADNRAPWLSVINNPDAATPAWTGKGDTIADAIGWQYGKDGGIQFPSYPDPYPRDTINSALYANHSLSFYGLPQMVTLYSPRLIQY